MNQVQRMLARKAMGLVKSNLLLAIEDQKKRVTGPDAEYSVCSLNIFNSGIVVTLTPQITENGLDLAKRLVEAAHKEALKRY
jgi:hypothetical protein